MLSALKRSNLIANQLSKSIARNYATVAKMTDTSKYKFNHTMLRVKDPKESVKFYEFLGMKQVNKVRKGRLLIS